jgi:stage V sporulation protein AE
MNYFLAFIIGGLICVIGQLLIDVFKLLPVHIVVIFVTFGAFLEMFNLYDYLIDFANSGALIPISSFGHTLTHSAVENALKTNYLGLFSGVFTSTSTGISITIFFAFIVALVTRPRG